MQAEVQPVPIPDDPHWDEEYRGIIKMGATFAGAALYGSAVLLAMVVVPFEQQDRVRELGGLGALALVALVIAAAFHSEYRRKRRS